MFSPHYNEFIILAMTRAFWQYPICRGPLDHSGSGSGHATTPARATLLLAMYELKYVLQCIVINKLFGNHRLILVLLFLFFSSLSTKHNWHHNRHNHGRRRRKWPPSASHEALCSAPTLLMDGRQPPKIADVFFGGVEGVYGLQSAPLFQR